MSEVHKILIVEGDVYLGKFLGRELGNKQFRVHIETDANADKAAEGLHNPFYDLIILGSNLLGQDGIYFVEEVRKALPQVRILVLAASNKTEDIVRALDHGADDYLAKPFSFVELVARIRSLLSRNVGRVCSSSMASDLLVNRDEFSAIRGRRRLDLTAREFDILEYMAKNRGKTISRQTLMEDVWKIPFDPTTNIVDVYMKYLRDKVDIEGEAKLIRTVRGVGYCLDQGIASLPCKDVEFVIETPDSAVLAESSLAA